MADRPIVIVADSRARHLGEHLARQFIHLDYKLIWQPGLRLMNVYNVACSTILEVKPKLIYILPGICDVTEIRSHEPRLILLRNPSVVSTVYSYITKLDLLHSQLFSINSYLGHYPMIVFPTQVGMHLSRYSDYPNELIHPHQNILNHSINEINKHITTQNKCMNITTPFLAAPIHIRCCKRVRHVYNKLQDGLHPSTAICKIWAEKLYENALINVNKYDDFDFSNKIYSNY